MQTKVGQKVSQKLVADQLDSSLHVSNVDADSVDKQSSIAKNDDVEKETPRQKVLVVQSLVKKETVVSSIKMPTNARESARDAASSVADGEIERVDKSTHRSNAVVA